MRYHVRALLLVVAAVFLAGTTWLRAETRILYYPTEDQSMFAIKVAAGWEVTGIDEVGEFGLLESENGSVLQFRAVDCETEEAAIAEIESIGDSTIELLEENYTDVQLGDVQELEIAGAPGFELSGTAKDKDGNEVAILSTTVILGKTTIAEVWAAVYPEDLASAKETLASFTPTGSSNGE
jgi:hypothetical protein